MSEPTVDRDPFELVAESFLARYRAGERPSVEEYAARYPELAEQIRELLPALVMVEQDLSIDPNARGSGTPLTTVPVRVESNAWATTGSSARSAGAAWAWSTRPSRSRWAAGWRSRSCRGRSRRPDGPGAVPPRGPRRGTAAPHQHRAGLRGGPGWRCPLLCHAVHPGPGPRRRHRRAAAAPRPGQIRVQDRRPPRRASRSGPAESDPATASRPRTRRSSRSQPVLRSILDRSVRPRRRAPGAGVRLESMLARAVAEASRHQPGPDGTSSPRLTRTAGTETDSPTVATRADRNSASARIGMVAVASPSSTSAILPGGTQLSSVESGRGAFFRSLAQIGRQVAGGLAYAHARGIVHRDIKPSNLLLDTEGVVWITDFGLAKGDDEGLTQTGDILGTLRYMAPERFRGEGDARADVYALGLTLYELLTLRPGFDSRGPARADRADQDRGAAAAAGHRCPDPARPGDDRA